MAKGDSDIELAWNEFEQLTNAKQEWLGSHRLSGAPDGKDPVWTTWADKCNLNLAACISLDSPKWRASILPGELRGLSRPVQQFLSEQAATKGSNLKAKVHGKVGDTLQHELAAVLFGPIAATPVCQLSDGALLTSDANSSAAQTGMPMESSLRMPENGTIIKLIWEYVAPEVPYFTQAIVYDPATIRPPDGTDTLDPMGGWSTRYKVAKYDQSDPKKSESVPCDKNLSTSPDGTSEVQLNCFYHYVFNSSGQGQDILDAISTELEPGGHPSAKSAMLLLVGAHVMVFNQKHKLWQWMTFYWTPQDNGRGWAEPWNHFQMKTTSASAEPTATQPGEIGPYQQIANPYLEGHIDGMSTNCVSCHSLAVYSPQGSRLTVGVPLAQTNKQPLELPGTPSSSGKASYPSTEFAAQKCGYFKGAARAHFIWSLANIGGTGNDSTVQSCLSP